MEKSLQKISAATNVIFILDTGVLLNVVQVNTGRGGKMSRCGKLLYLYVGD